MLASERLKIVHLDRYQLAASSRLAQKQAADFQPAPRKRLKSFQHCQTQPIHHIQAQIYGYAFSRNLPKVVQSCSRRTHLAKLYSRTTAIFRKLHPDCPDAYQTGANIVVENPLPAATNL
ncbi:MAG TPA: hypothetical protein VME43_01030 [Bryobacteraceae bacterium]|nr:hypothetical protein [Bryobacteraceae bacterium]